MAGMEWYTPLRWSSKKVIWFDQLKKWKEFLSCARISSVCLAIEWLRQMWAWVRVRRYRETFLLAKRHAGKAKIGWKEIYLYQQSGTFPFKRSSNDVLLPPLFVEDSNLRTGSCKLPQDDFRFFGIPAQYPGPLALWRTKYTYNAVKYAQDEIGEATSLYANTWSPFPKQERSIPLHSVAKGVRARHTSHQNLKRAKNLDPLR